LVCGPKPLWLVASRGGFVVHPMDSGLGAVHAFCGFHNVNCPHGYIAAALGGDMRICTLPLQVREGMCDLGCGCGCVLEHMTKASIAMNTHNTQGWGNHSVGITKYPDPSSSRISSVWGGDRGRWWCGTFPRLPVCYNTSYDKQAGFCCLEPPSPTRVCCLPTCRPPPHLTPPSLPPL
jgi:hypothetical protein